MIESNYDLPPFYVGEEVVCKLPHSKNKLLIVGKKYKVHSIKKCSCNKWAINISLGTTNGLGTTCHDCNDFLSLRHSGIAYFSTILFAATKIDFSSLFLFKLKNKKKDILILETLISIN